MRVQSIPALGVTLGVIAIAAGGAFAAQDRSTLKVPDGLSFSEFKDYESWRNVAVSETKDQIKVIQANPVMLAAFKSGLPAKGQTFPDGSKVVKIEWTHKANPLAPYAVEVPDQLAAIAFIEKDTKRFPKTHGWAYAKFDADPATGALKPEGTGPECGYACHTAVAAQDYIFTAYPPR